MGRSSDGGVPEDRRRKALLTTMLAGKRHLDRAFKVMVAARLEKATDGTSSDMVRPQTFIAIRSYAASRKVSSTSTRPRCRRSSILR